MKKDKIYKHANTKKSKILPGDSSESPDDFSKVIVFIDNAYFLRLKKYFFDEGIKFSVKNFVNNILNKNNLKFEKIFLYDAPPFQSEGPSQNEKEMKELYDSFVSRFKKEDIIVREGRTQRLKVDGNFIYRQKGVDMLLGIDAVSVSKTFPKIKKIVLLTGDSDFVPVVEKLKEIEIETILLTYFDRIRKSSFSRCNELLKSCKKYIKISKEDFEEVFDEK